jgi:hypothetical protein
VRAASTITTSRPCHRVPLLLDIVVPLDRIVSSQTELVH